MANRFEQPAVVEPIDPLKGGILDRLERLSRAAPMDDLGLEQPDDRLSQSIIVRVSDAADGGLDARLARRSVQRMLTNYDPRSEWQTRPLPATGRRSCRAWSRASSRTSARA